MVYPIAKQKLDPYFVFFLDVIATLCTETEQFHADMKLSFVKSQDFTWSVQKFGWTSDCKQSVRERNMEKEM